MALPAPTCPTPFPATSQCWRRRVLSGPCLAPLPCTCPLPFPAAQTQPSKLEQGLISSTVLLPRTHTTAFFLPCLSYLRLMPLLSRSCFLSLPAPSLSKAHTHSPPAPACPLRSAAAPCPLPATSPPSLAAPHSSPAPRHSPAQQVPICKPSPVRPPTAFQHTSIPPLSAPFSGRNLPFSLVALFPSLSPGTAPLSRS